MNKKKYYLTIKEPIFCIYFIMYYFALFMNDIAIDNTVTEPLVKLIKIISCILAIVEISNKKINKINFGFFILEFALISVLFLSSHDIAGILLLIISFCSFAIDKNKIFKISLFCIVIFTVITLLLCFMGIVPNIITRRTGLSYKNRYSLGFLHSSNLPLNFFYFFTYYIALHKGKITIKIFCLFSLSSFLLYKICGSNNAFLGVISICFILLVGRIFQSNKLFNIIVKLISKNIFLILFILSFIPVFLREKGIKMEWWYYYDTIFTNRTYLGSTLYRMIGIHFINFMNSEDYFSNYIVIDNGYMFILLRYGIYAAVLFIILNRMIYKYYRDNINMLLIFIIIAAVNYTDNDFLSFGYLPFMIITINNINCNFCRRKVNVREFQQSATGFSYYNHL